MKEFQMKMQLLHLLGSTVPNSDITKMIGDAKLMFDFVNDPTGLEDKATRPSFVKGITKEEYESLLDTQKLYDLMWANGLEATEVYITSAQQFAAQKEELATRL